MTNFTKKLIISFLVAFAVSACATPPALTKLTRETGDNAISLSVALSNLEKKSRETSKVRIDTIARLAGVIARHKAAHAHEVAMVSAFENAKVGKAHAAILTLSDEEAARFAATAQSSENDRSETLKKIAALDSDADDLRNLGGELLKFSKEEGALDRGKFFVAFVKAVVNDLKKSEEAGDKAKGAAEEAVKKVEKNAPKAASK
jgi:hypothetical protein